MMDCVHAYTVNPFEPHCLPFFLLMSGCDTVTQAIYFCGTYNDDTASTELESWFC
jgi:hypothetical protein